MTMPGHWPVGGGRSVLASGTTRAALRRVVREELAKRSASELGAETPEGAQDKVDAAVAMLRSELQTAQQQDADRYAQKYIEEEITSGRLSQAALTNLIDGRVNNVLDAKVPGAVAQAIGADDTVLQAAAAAINTELIEGQAADVLADVLAPVDAPLAPRRRFMAGLDPSATRLLFLPHTDHGWTLSGGSNGSAIGLDPDRRGPFTAESLYLIRPLGSSLVLAERSGLPPVDLNDGPLVVWVHLPNPAPAGVNVRLGQNSSNVWHWNISGAQDPDRAGHHLDGWTAFELFPEAATQVGTPTRDNNTYARVALIGTNQEAWVGGIGQRLLPRASNGALAYPNGVLTLFFDDGYESQYTHALPVLARHGFPGVLGTIVSYVDTPGFMTTNQLRQLQDNAGWEIAAHSWSPNGPEYRFDQFTPTELEREFRRMKTWLVSNGFDSDTWVSPGGVFSRTIWETGRRYFTLHRGVSGAGSGPGVTAGAYQASPRRAYPSIVTPNFGTTTNTLTNLKAVVDGVKAAKSWGSMAFHQVTDQGPSSGQVISVADLTEITDYIAAQGVPVRTVKQILADVN